MRISLQLAIAVVATLAITILTAGIAVTVSRSASDSLTGHIAKELESVAVNVAEDMANVMRERYRDIDGLRQILEVEAPALPADKLRELLDRVRQSYVHYSWLGIVTKDGTIQIGTGGLLEGRNIVNRDWFVGGLEGPYIGDSHPALMLQPHVGNEDGAPLYLLDIAFPLRAADGTVVGVLGSHLNWRMMELIARRGIAIAARDTVVDIAIVGDNGAVLFATEGIRNSIDHVLPKAEPDKVVRVRENGTDYFVAIARTRDMEELKQLGWTVLVREESRGFLADVTSLRKHIYLVSLSLALVALLLGVWWLRRINRPLRVLSAGLSQFGSGDMREPEMAETYIAEYETLQSSFAQMVARVRSHTTELTATQREIIHSLARAGELRDNETGNHVIRMSLCCRRLAELRGIAPEEAEFIGLASQMHDLGKIGIPDEVLLKPGRLTQEERSVMERHAELGAKVLGSSEVPLVAVARTICLSHHEKWDGSGYPHGLSGEHIPLEGRIAALCDVFDALLSERPYKAAWPVEKVIEFIKAQQNQHFDPVLADLFLAHFDEFLAIRDRYLD